MHAPVARGQGHWTFVALSCAALSGLFALRFLTTPGAPGPSPHEQLGLPPCTMIELTGIPCPGCGVTTAMSYFARGEFERAALFQPFGALLASGSVLLFVWALVETVRGRDAWADFRRICRPWFFWSLGAAMLAAWIYKIVELRG